MSRSPPLDTGASAWRGRHPLTALGVVLSTCGLGLGSGLILLSHPAFALGVWADSQPMVVGLLVAGALCSLGVAFQVPRSRLARRAALHPATLAPLALGCWSLLVAPWADKPLRSVFGAAQSGQGVLWYVALAAFVAAALTLTPARRVWGGIVVVAAASSLLAAVLGVQGLDWLYPWLVDHDLVPSVRLLRFNEHLAYPALVLAVLALIAWDDGHKVRPVALGLVVLAVLLLSRNRTAWLVLPLVLAAALWLRGRLTLDARRSGGLVAAVALVGLVPLVLIFMADDGPLSMVHSLWSRAVIAHSLAPSVIDGVGHLLTGRGWGAVPDEMVRNIPASGVALYESQWGGLERDIFHSHNAVLEGMMATGLPGAVLAGVLPASVLLCGQRRRFWPAVVLAVSWAALDAFWFMVPASPPLIALAVAAVIGRPRRWCVIPPPILASAAGACAVLMAGGAGLLAAQGLQESRLIAALSAPVEREPSDLPMDLRGDGYGLAAILTQALGQVEAAPPDEARARAQRVLHLQEQLEQKAERAAAPALSMALVNGLSTEAFAAPETPLAFADDDRLARRWGRQVIGLLTQAPQRLDAAAPYFNWLLIKGRLQTLADFVAAVKRLDGVDTAHPVLLWFEGSLALQSDAPAVRNEGLRRMRRALREGLERFLPIADAVKRALS